MKEYECTTTLTVTVSADSLEEAENKAHVRFHEKIKYGNFTMTKVELEPEPVVEEDTNEYLCEHEGCKNFVTIKDRYQRLRTVREMEQGLKTNPEFLCYLHAGVRAKYEGNN